MVSSTVGSSTCTGWNRRSSAASFSIYLRYSSKVVAPMQCSSPRASIGLSRLPASMEPSVLPAPTMVCNSSMNSKILPSLFLISSKTAFSRSSNSPRYFAPAISAPISSANTVLFFSPSGTSPLTIRCASPSTMAVLPTPGSPMSTGLFLLFRDRIRMTLRISASLPMTGSIFCSRARLTKSEPYLVSASYVSSGLSAVTREVFTVFNASRKVFSFTPYCRNNSVSLAVGCRKSASMKCSTEIYSSCMDVADFSASVRTASVSGAT